MNDCYFLDCSKVQSSPKAAGIVEFLRGRRFPAKIRPVLRSAASDAEHAPRGARCSGARTATAFELVEAISRPLVVDVCGVRDSD